VALARQQDRLAESVVMDEIPRVGLVAVVILGMKTAEGVVGVKQIARFGVRLASNISRSL